MKPSSKRPIRLIAAASVMLVCVLADSGLYSARRYAAYASQDGQEGLFVGAYPPRVPLKDLSGKKYSLKDYQDKVVILHFWATWCPFCRKEVPKLMEVYDQWGATDVEILAVSLDEDRKQLESFVSEHALPYTVIADEASQFTAADRYGISGIPVTYIIEPGGRIARRLLGPSDIRGQVQSVLKQPQASLTKDSHGSP